MNVFDTAEEAFEFYFDNISRNGVMHSGAKAIFNQCFVILDPLKADITTPWRKWSPAYVTDEWKWYSSGDPNISAFEEIRGDRNIPPIWYDHADKDGNVRSQYGWQWQRNGQIDYVIDELKRHDESRRALITIYDGKEHDTYQHDTPCTLNYHFQILEGKLNLTVMMRSNDLVWGFCNDQYMAKNLMEQVSKELDIPVGELTWFASNLHIYPDHLDMKSTFKEGIIKRV